MFGGIFVECSLSDLCPGERGMVQQMDINKVLNDRLKDFGFVTGTKVSCDYLGPGRKVMAVGCRGCVIALRTRDLQKIRVSIHE